MAEMDSSPASGTTTTAARTAPAAAAFTPGANCMLSAAAPALHQALVEVLGDYREGLARLRPRTLKLIVAALAKANGDAA